MNYGFVLPRGDARTAADFAFEAEQAGWDGFFVWEPVWGVDAWICLTAAAMRTERIRLGTMITPVSRMRPWKLASGFESFGEVTDRKTRAELLDEGLAIVTGLWQGQPFSFEGKHYHVQPCDFFPPPPPVQQPRIPIWVVGAWPRPKSMRRALRWDGLLPAKMDAEGKFVEFTPDDLHAARAYITDHRESGAPFDVVVEGLTPGDDPAAAAARVRPWIEAGATWWIEAMWDAMDDQPAVLARIRQGPPKG
jgi:alkanesulfonate monooxygenase SsuD/methylene tetrahydromethanopterin reductase-like flavin-dependent oxidoreductase (luciferase family)